MTSRATHGGAGYDATHCITCDCVHEAKYSLLKPLQGVCTGKECRNTSVNFPQTGTQLDTSECKHNSPLCREAGEFFNNGHLNAWNSVNINS